MIIVSENIMVSQYHGIKQSKQFFLGGGGGLNRCLEACAYSNLINQKQSSKLNH